MVLPKLVAAIAGKETKVEQVQQRCPAGDYCSQRRLIGIVAQLCGWGCAFLEILKKPSHEIDLGSWWFE